MWTIKRARARAEYHDSLHLYEYTRAPRRKGLNDLGNRGISRHNRSHVSERQELG